MTPYAWWSSLRHEGLLIAPDRLAERFPAAPEPVVRAPAEILALKVVDVAVGSGAFVVAGLVHPGCLHPAPVEGVIVRRSATTWHIITIDSEGCGLCRPGWPKL